MSISIVLIFLYFFILMDKKQSLNSIVLMINIHFKTKFSVYSIYLLLFLRKFSCNFTIYTLYTSGLRDATLKRYKLSICTILCAVDG